VGHGRRRSSVLNLLLALLTAALLVLAFPRFDVSWLAAVALGPLLVAMGRERRAARRFLLGWVAGLAWWLGTCYWIQFVLQRHSGLPAAGSWVGLLLFAIFKALHMAVFAVLGGIALRRGWALAAVPALWVAIERTHGPLGFAWLALGNAGIDMELPMRLAPYTGVYGLSFVFAMLGAALAAAGLGRRRQLAWLLLLPPLLLLPRLPAPQAGTQAAVLVQPNIAGDADWTEPWVRRMEQRLAFLSLRAATEQGGGAPQLVVWPEVPLPAYYYENARFRELVSEVARSTRAHLLLNVVPHDARGAPLNSALLLDPYGRPLGRYDKLFLVPFGEYVPAPFQFVSKISSEVGDFVPGRDLVVLRAGGRPIGAFICYEAVFPHLVRRFAAAGAQLLVNLSNDGWYGRTAARDQHLKIARMRAAENGRWMLRATNDGITATIDPAGRVYRPLPSYVEAAVRTSFTYLESKTLYTRYGDWFVALCAVVAAVSLLPPWRRRFRLRTATRGE